MQASPAILSPFTLKAHRAFRIHPHRWIALAWGLSGYLLITSLTTLFIRQVLKK